MEIRYRSLSLQENFGTIAIKSFKESKVMPAYFSSFSTGGKLPAVASHPTSERSSAVPQLQSLPKMVHGSSTLGKRHDNFVICVSIVIVIGISAIIYWHYNRREKEGQKRPPPNRLMFGGF